MLELIWALSVVYTNSVFGVLDKKTWGRKEGREKDKKAISEDFEALDWEN